MAENVVNIVAIELLVAAQGCDFHAPTKSSAPLERVRTLLRKHVQQLDQDRYLALDIATSADILRSGELIPAAEVELPSLEGTSE